MNCPAINKPCHYVHTCTPKFCARKQPDKVKINWKPMGQPNPGPTPKPKKKGAK